MQKESGEKDLIGRICLIRLETTQGDDQQQLTSGGYLPAFALRNQSMPPPEKMIQKTEHGQTHAFGETGRAMVHCERAAAYLADRGEIRISGRLRRTAKLLEAIQANIKAVMGDRG